MNIRKETIGTGGALIHDGWTRNGTYCFVVVASTMESIHGISGGELITEQNLILQLLSVSTFSHLHEDGNTTNSKAITRNTETHIRHLKDVPTYYHLTVYEWKSCLIGDSCNLNLCIARSTKLSHVGCSNHKLTSEVLRMIDNLKYFSETLSTVRSIMQSFRSSFSNRAILGSSKNL